MNFNALVVPGVDILAERKVSDRRAGDVVPGDLTQDVLGRKRYRAAHMRQPPVRRHEGQGRARAPLDAEHADIHAIFQVLLAEVFRNRPVFAHRADVELFARPERQLPFRGERGDAAEDGLVRSFELDQHEMPVHRDVLEVVPVRKHEVGVKFEPALLEAAKNADDLLSGKQI